MSDNNNHKDTKCDTKVLAVKPLEPKTEITASNTSPMQKEVQEMLENDLSCAICQDIYINPLILNCSHSFCKFCVYQWLSKKSGCPTCRVTVCFQAENLALRNIVNKMFQKSNPQYQQLRENSVTQRLKDEEAQKKDGTIDSLLTKKGNILHGPFQNNMPENARRELEQRISNRAWQHRVQPQEYDFDLDAQYEWNDVYGITDRADDNDEDDDFDSDEQESESDRTHQSNDLSMLADSESVEDDSRDETFESNQVASESSDSDCSSDEDPMDYEEESSTSMSQDDHSESQSEIDADESDEDESFRIDVEGDGNILNQSLDEDDSDEDFPIPSDLSRQIDTSLSSESSSSSSSSNDEDESFERINDSNSDDEESTDQEEEDYSDDEDDDDDDNDEDDDTNDFEEGVVGSRGGRARYSDESTIEYASDESGSMLVTVVSNIHRGIRRPIPTSVSRLRMNAKRLRRRRNLGRNLLRHRMNRRS